MKSKRCKDCKKRLPLKQFYVGGTCPRCKKCYKAWRAAYASKPKVPGRKPGRPPSVSSISEARPVVRVDKVTRALELHALNVAERCADLR